MPGVLTMWLDQERSKNLFLPIRHGYRVSSKFLHWTTDLHLDRNSVTGDLNKNKQNGFTFSNRNRSLFIAFVLCMYVWKKDTAKLKHKIDKTMTKIRQFIFYGNYIFKFKDEL